MVSRKLLNFEDIKAILNIGYVDLDNLLFELLLGVSELTDDIMT